MADSVTNSGEKLTFEQAWERMYGLKDLSQPKRSQYTVAYTQTPYPPREATSRSLRLTTFPIEEPRTPLVPSAPGLPSELRKYVGVEERRLRTTGERSLSSAAILSATWQRKVAYDAGSTTYRRDFGDPAAERLRSYKQTL
jgi:hypothetical protein